MKNKTYAKKGGDYATLVEVLRQDDAYDEPFTFGCARAGTLNEVIDSLLRIKMSIPEKYRDDATCTISSYTSYGDSCYATIAVDYMRPATDKEIAELEKENERRKYAKEVEERRKLKELMAKYGEK